MGKTTKTLLIVAGAGAVGYFLGALTGRRRAAIQAEAQGPPVARMARDMRLMCRDLDPLLSQIERSYADGNVSAGDIMTIASQANRLL